MEASTNADSAALGMKIHNEQSLGISAHFWAFLPKPGHFCLSLGISAHFWAFLPRPGHFCLSLGISAQALAFLPKPGHFLPISGHFCPFLARNACARARLPRPACLRLPVPPYIWLNCQNCPDFSFVPFSL